MDSLAAYDAQPEPAGRDTGAAAAARSPARRPGTRGRAGAPASAPEDWTTTGHDPRLDVWPPALRARLPWPGHWAPLGAHFDGSGTNFALWAAGAEKVELCLFGRDGAEQRVELAERTFHVWHGYLPGVLPGQHYGFRVHGPWLPLAGARWNPHKLLIDPYARAIDGGIVLADAVFGHHREHGRGDDTVMDTRDSAPFVPKSVVVHDVFDWSDERRPNTAWADSVIYELHVKGFTARHPGVPPQLRGTYAGLAHPAAVEHLTRLGVTAVELMPVHHFITEEHLVRTGLVNYWGYNSLGYFAPHGPYSASGSGGQQVREFKAMVKALHNAGIEVILDVVYNHTAEGSEGGPTLSLRGIDNAGYYRLADGGRRYADYTGTGNTLNAVQPHVIQLITDSLRYWVTEMHVDGFRFDLASALARSFHDVDKLSAFLTVIQQDPVLSKVKLIAEPWDIAEGGYQVGEFPPLWTEWNDKYRDCVRDYWRGARAGVRDLAYRLSGSSDLYEADGRRPYASINHVTAHDGFTLRDLVSYNGKHNEANCEDNRDGTPDNHSWNCGIEGETPDPAIRELRHRQIRNMLATCLLSTGVPMLLAGDEMGRTQRGNNNAYCQDNDTSWLDWECGPEWRQLPDFTRTLIRLRRDHPVLRQSMFFSGSPVHSEHLQDLAWFHPEGRQMTDDDWFAPLLSLGMYLSGKDIRGRGPRGEAILDDSFLLILHADPADAAFHLPPPPWATAYDLVLSTAHDGPPPPTSYPAGTPIPVPARTLLLLRADHEEWWPG